MSRLSRRPPRRTLGSWPGGWVVRPVTAEDIRTLIGGDIDPEYSTLSPVGYAAERDGALVAAGSVTWDRAGRAWGWLNCCEPVPPRILHCCALEMLAMLRGVGEPAVSMIVNQSVHGAERWARRLGFVPDAAMTHPWGPVFRCTLSDK